ncbi:hypothetical protein [Streptomyces xinghaiensis]|uniref:hypothetical protein n=1 Tax=Streptomyces xinghaiensis TaxID=1038928 RepID=UPI00030CC2FC
MNEHQVLSARAEVTRTTIRMTTAPARVLRASGGDPVELAQLAGLLVQSEAAPQLLADRL